MGMILNNVRKKYSEKMAAENEVLKGISLEINQGEMVAIVGKSGAGKSTLLHILGCLDSEFTGEYSVDDIKINKLSHKKLARLRNEKFGFVLQDFGLINDDTVLESVMLPLMFNKTRIMEMKQKAMEYLKLIGIEELAMHKVATLSGGEKQRTAMARALINEPDYILADEPTGALDTNNAERVMDILHKIHKSGKTMVIITHDEGIAKQCDRIINIKDGLIE